MEPWVIVAAVLVVGINVILLLGWLTARASIGNEVKAKYALKTLVAAQHEYRCYRSGNGPARFASELIQFFAVASEEAKTKSGRFAVPRPSILPRDFSEATSPEKSLNGYFFLTPGAEGPSLAHAGAERKTVDWSREFEMAAVPEEHGKTGRFVFFVAADGKLRQKDVKRQILRWTDLEGERPLAANTGWRKV